MYLNDKSKDEVLDNIIFVSGSARSGTTILGKVISTMQDIEYFFEPPLLFNLFHQATDENFKIIESVFETYMYEDLYMGSISGRQINLRRQDDSSIYWSKSEEEVNSRLRSSARKSELSDHRGRICFKVPDFVYKEQLIKRIANEPTTVRLVRDPNETINSLVAKGWFSDTSIRRSDIIWPNQYYMDYFVPHWLEEENWALWGELSEVDRCLLYYLSQTDTEQAADVVVDYGDLIGSPEMTIAKLSQILSLKTGPMTSVVTQTIEPQNSTSRELTLPYNRGLLEKAIESYNRSRGLAI